MKNFLKYSQLLGRQPALAQGAGGNASVKIDKLMLVKASGVSLRAMKKNTGYVGLRFMAINSYLLKMRKYHESLELAFDELVKSNVISKQNFGQPSIETGLHAIVPSKYVFHTHSVWANVLNCADDGDIILQNLFGKNILIIPYKNPGLELAFALAQEVKTGKLPNIIFLKNHGLITHHANAAKAFALTGFVQLTIAKFLQQHKAFTPFFVKKQPANLQKHLFPDSVVYGQINFKTLSLQKQRTYWEICSVTNYILHAIKLLHTKPVFLPKQRVNFIVNMEQEKYRLHLFKQI